MNVDLQQIMMRPWMAKSVCVCLVLFWIYLVGSGIHQYKSIKNMSVISHAQDVLLQAEAPQTIPKDLKTSLFGDYIPDSASLQQSMLHIKLVGVVYAAETADSQVIINTLGGSDKLYRVGDLVTRGVHIKRILRDGIVIERDGVLERIMLPKNK